MYSGAFFELLKIIEATHRVDTIGCRDETCRTLRVPIEVLVYSVWWDVDHVSGLPLKFFDLVLRLPVVRVRYLHVAILVEVVTVALENIEALLGEVSVLTGSTSLEE